MPALRVAKLIEDKIFIPLASSHVILTSDLIKNLCQKIKRILESAYTDLHALSAQFWSSPIEKPVIIEEVLSALVLKFLSEMNDSIYIETILDDMKSAKFTEFVYILKKMIVSKELKSFNISAFILFSSFKYLNTLRSEAGFWSTQNHTIIENFNKYSNPFIEFLSRNSIFVEYLKNICHIDDDTFKNQLNTALRNTFLVKDRDLNWYGVDAFTTYDRKIYIKNFNTQNPVLDKGATFYVLLHELCHFFRRIFCITWEDSRRCKTPKEFIDNRWQKEGGNIFEVKYFGKRHKFLNEKASNFLLFQDENLPREQYSKLFASKNELKGDVYVSLKRGSSPGKKDVVELSGCLISRYREDN
ncbi:hypothetical protein SteCoe_39025 [Stentor coeruleus]|uniref:SprT-like domain-containing protein n=1 Tax=Stentor coeruleus TaxID=5963 RepID=A0A1R2AKV1_9CILI|nr:hypothetical protein SteCoe_39025 [Stentor coeruleus]